MALGAVLILLNLDGLSKSPDWAKWTALVFQLELLLTGLAGWCPLYRSLRRRRKGADT
ncbi:MAG: DUF2892 domain-containing protein [Planctomycetes bacterium]|nr:DUF2892 domain-containing protein [Planctomycetota bacterium]